MQNTTNEEYRSEYASLMFHPYNVLLFLTILSLSILFVSLTAAFMYTRFTSDMPPLKLPGIFLFNTLILLGSSYTMWWAKQAYLKDDTKKYQQALVFTVALSVLFLVAQIIGWQALFNQSIFIHSSNSAGYLYIISGLHFAHVIGGLPFLGLFLWTAYKRMKEPISVLIYFSDPEKRLKLRLLSIYWHFLDALWIYLVLFFTINYLVQ